MSQIWIKGYTKKDGVRVKGHYTKDRGKPGRTPKRERVLPRPTKGELSKFGYYDLKYKSDRARQMALHRAIKVYGYRTVMGKVNLIRNYNKNYFLMHNIMSRDVEWLKQKMKPRYGAKAQKLLKKSRKKSLKSARKNK